VQLTAGRGGVQPPGLLFAVELGSVALSKPPEQRNENRTENSHRFPRAQAMIHVSCGRNPYEKERRGQIKKGKGAENKPLEIRTGSRSTIASEQKGSRCRSLLGGDKNLAHSGSRRLSKIESTFYQITTSTERNGKKGKLKHPRSRYAYKNLTPAGRLPPLKQSGKGSKHERRSEPDTRNFGVLR